MRLSSVRAPALAALLLLALALALALAVRPPDASASTRCPASFRVLHNDRIGSLSLPGGSYQLRVQGLSCARAANLFPVFLNDYDGRLPGGWTVGVRSRGRGVFRRGSTSFSVTLRSPSGGGGGPVVDLTCTTTFAVATPTQAGLLPLPRGQLPPHAAQLRLAELRPGHAAPDRLPRADHPAAAQRLGQPARRRGLRERLDDLRVPRRRRAVTAGRRAPAGARRLSGRPGSPASVNVAPGDGQEAPVIAPRAEGELEDAGGRVVGDLEPGAGGAVRVVAAPAGADDELAHAAGRVDRRPTALSGAQRW